MKKRIRHLAQQWLRAARRLEQKLAGRQRDQKHVRGALGEHTGEWGQLGWERAGRKIHLWKHMGLQRRSVVLGHDSTGIWDVAGLVLLNNGGGFWRRVLVGGDGVQLPLESDRSPLRIN